MSTPRLAVGALILFDTDILYPVRLCDFFLTAGTVGLIAKPIVSDGILIEAQRNVTADRADLGEDRIKGRFDAVRTATSGAGDPISKRYFNTTIVNEKDRHVLAAARFHSVDFVVTNDARLRREVSHWTSEQLRPHPAEAITADEVIGRLVAENPAQVRAVLQAMADRSRQPAKDVRRRPRCAAPVATWRVKQYSPKTLRSPQLRQPRTGLPSLEWSFRS